MIQIKRAYEEPRKTDGYRVLVDRVWPRGRTKEQLALKEWARDLAPSNALRQSFGHDPARWESFQKKYRQELQTQHDVKVKLAELAKLARRETVTLVYGAHDQEHNQAVVLKEVVERL